MKNRSERGRRTDCSRYAILIAFRRTDDSCYLYPFVANTVRTRNAIARTVLKTELQKLPHVVVARFRAIVGFSDQPRDAVWL